MPLGALRVTHHDALRALPTNFSDISISSGTPRNDSILIDYDELRRKQAELAKLRRLELEANKWRNGESVNWLEWLDHDPALERTDITSGEWVARHHDKCSDNLQIEGKEGSFYHPMFKFKDPISAVHITMRKNNEEKPFWDVYYAGGPGGPRTVTNLQVPSGGKHPRFPEFCPPLLKTDVYTLKLEHKPMGKQEGRTPKFDIELRLRPKLEIPKMSVDTFEENTKAPSLADRGLAEIVGPPKVINAADWKRDMEWRLNKIVGPPPRPVLPAYDTSEDTETNGEAIAPRMKMTHPPSSAELAKSRLIQLAEWDDPLQAKMRNDMKKRIRGEKVVDESRPIPDAPIFVEDGSMAAMPDAALLGSCLHNPLSFRSVVQSQSAASQRARRAGYFM